MDFGIAGKVALSSGGSKGMGKAVSIDLAREGCKVVVCARGQEAVDETVAEIRDSGGEAVPAYVDMVKRDGIAEAVRIAETSWGSPDIVIGNVYGPRHGRFEETTDEDFQEAYDQMLMSQVHLLRAVTPAMKEKGWGRIVLIGSISSKQPHKELPLVSANVTRTAALALNRSVANELGQYGITVNTIGTGGFATERYFEYMRGQAEANGVDFDEHEATRRDGYPIGRLGRPDEMSAVIVFLCSDRASYVTGQFVLVDGGAVNTLM